jgi:hypothetical protein
MFCEPLVAKRPVQRSPPALQASAYVEDHVMVVDSPSVIEAGFAASVVVGGTSVTVMTRGVALVAPHVIVSVYVPASEGYSTAEPCGE